VRIGVNWLSPDSLMSDLMAHMDSLGVVGGGPDVVNWYVTQGDRMFAGLNATGGSTLIDYRDRLAWAPEVQWQSLLNVNEGGHEGDNATDAPIPSLYAASLNGYTSSFNGFSPFVMPGMKTKYLIWYRQQSSNDTPNKFNWLTGILPFIRSVNGKVYQVNGVTPPPTRYTGGIIV
jgi:hypothetical protein